MKKFFWVMIFVSICSFAIYNVVKAEMTSSKYTKLHNKFFNALSTCTPTKVHIPGECQGEICDGGYEREVVGKEGDTCKVIDAGRTCNFPMSIIPRLINIGKNVARSVDSGVLDVNSSDVNIIWSERMYKEHCK